MIEANGQMMAPSNRSDLFSTILDELRPFPGRLRASIQITLCVVIVVVLAMSQQVPEAALSCYLIFFANRNNAASGIVIAVGLILAASVGILLGVLFLEVASGNAMVRMALIAAFTFGGMYFSVATPAGSIPATAGFVFVFVLTLEDFVPVPELLARGLSWMWVVVFFPMATLVLVNVLMGKSPLTLARSAIAERLQTAAKLLSGVSVQRQKISSLLAEDPEELATSIRLAPLLGYTSKKRAERFLAAIPQAQSLLAGSIGAKQDTGLASEFRQLAEVVESGSTPPRSWSPASSTGSTQPLGKAAARLAGIMGDGPVPEDEVEPAPAVNDTFTNPAYLQFALKTTLAVFITYSIYTVGEWFEIHTAMITCFYVALGTTGETLHKATLRIIGCLLGAVMGVGSIVLLMPHMTDIGQLMLLVAACTFLAAWVANGSSLIEYAGWQMALAFFLCVLHGYTPTVDLDVATDRIVGILIGNVVVAVVFLVLWPVSVTTSIGRHVSRGASRLTSALHSSLAVVDAAVEISQARRLTRLSVFEPAWLRTRSATLPRYAATLDAIELALPEITRLQMLRGLPRFLRGAPHCVKVATQAQEASVAGFLQMASDAMVNPSPKDRSNLVPALEKARVCLRRLERLEKLAPKRAPWRRDVLSLIYAYRKLLLGLSSTLEAL